MGLCTSMMSALAVTASRLTSVMGFYIRTPASLGNNPAAKPRITTPVQDFSTGVDKFSALFSVTHFLIHSHRLFLSFAWHWLFKALVCMNKQSALEIIFLYFKMYFSFTIILI